MMKIPAQHNTTNPPGQIVNPVPKQESEKLSFDEWYSKFPKLDIKDLEKVRYIKYKSIWEAAQENK